MFSDLAVNLDIFSMDGNGLRRQSALNFFQRVILDFLKDLFHSFNGPEEIAGRGSRFLYPQGYRGEVLLHVFLGGQVCNAQGDSHSRGNSDGGSSSYHHALNGFGHFFHASIGVVNLLGRQQSLIDHDHSIVGPLNGSNHGSTLQ